MNWIAKLGQNQQFVAAIAHFFFAGYVIMWFPHWWLALAITVAAAGKEFWYDRLNEHNPPQTTLDNVEDFAGYVAGAWITYLFVIAFSNVAHSIVTAIQVVEEMFVRLT